jgi:ATP-binding cassette subfamily B protein
MILGATGAAIDADQPGAALHDVHWPRLIDGQDVRQIQQDSLLAHIAIVPQDTVLFSGSVRDNIRYGNPEARDDEVIAAARAAQAHDFILELSSGYDTHIEERGVNLSGGQKQRIAIARALLAHPIVIWTTGRFVDVETERRLDALDGQQRGIPVGGGAAHRTA